MDRDIFISYRSDDSEGWTSFIGTHLQKEFGDDRVYLDADSLEPGQRYADVLLAHVTAAKVFIPVVGRNWLRATNKNSGMRRLDEPLDLLRREIETAIAGHKLIIPVMVDGADIPAPADLPSSIRSLFEIEVVRITGKTKKGDIARLLLSVRKGLGEKTESSARLNDAITNVAAPASAFSAQTSVQTAKALSTGAVDPKPGLPAETVSKPTPTTRVGSDAAPDTGQIYARAVPTGFIGLCFGLIAFFGCFTLGLVGNSLSSQTASLFGPPLSWMVPVTVYIVASGAISTIAILIAKDFSMPHDESAIFGSLAGVLSSAFICMELRVFGLSREITAVIFLLPVLVVAHLFYKSNFFSTLSDARFHVLLDDYASMSLTHFFAAALLSITLMWNIPGIWNTFTFWPIISVSSWTELAFGLVVAIPVVWVAFKALNA
jgi:hypothetical protein